MSQPVRYSRAAANRGAYAQRAGRYPYPASYSYYPTRSAPYGTRKKSWYPLIIVALGIALIVFSFLKVDKLDSRILNLAARNPNGEIAALIFCNPCTSIQGETIGPNKRMVIDTALKISQMADFPGVVQIKLVGSV